MKILIAGASGATGRLLTKELLDRGQIVKVILRPQSNLADSIKKHENLEIIRANILEISDSEMVQYVSDCSAVASCLGHNLSFRGIFGPPFRLVTEAVHRLCDAIKTNTPRTPVKFVLMNTTGNRNHDLYEPISFGEKILLGILRVVMPPQSDNETAAEYLRVKIGVDDEYIEWAAVRPDSLVNADEVSEYELYPSPVRSAVFNPGKTSRINVAHFMADLITDPKQWDRWKGQMPVIYNQEIQ